jgi:hypothetical protein
MVIISRNNGKAVVVTSEDSEEAKRKIDMFKRLKNEIHKRL